MRWPSGGMPTRPGIIWNWAYGWGRIRRLWRPRHRGRSRCSGSSWLIRARWSPEAVTYENTVNLAATFKDRILSRYEGTRLGRQELYAELLEDTPGALWTRVLLEQTRVRTLPPLRRIVIGLDPGGEAGIVVAALGDDGHGYVLEDLSLSGSPATWAGQAIAGYHKYHANLIVAEAQPRGRHGATNARHPGCDRGDAKVWASQGKYARAEPVTALYEKGRVHHVGMFAALEDELCNWVPGEGLPSPNRLDALVWALTELLLQGDVPLPQVDLRHGPGGDDQDGPRGGRGCPAPARTWGTPAGTTTIRGPVATLVSDRPSRSTVRTCCWRASPTPRTSPHQARAASSRKNCRASSRMAGRDCARRAPLGAARRRAGRVRERGRAAWPWWHREQRGGVGASWASWECDG